MANYLLDTNYFVYLTDSNAEPTKKEEVLKDFVQKLSDPNSRFMLTPLIRYEVLRGVKWEDKSKLTELEEILKQFKSLDIRDEIADLARDLYRFDSYEADLKGERKNLEKRKFDMFHYATAQLEELDVLSKDSDLPKIADLHQRMNTEKQNAI